MIYDITSAEEKLQYYEQQYRIISDLLQKIEPCAVTIEGGVVQCIGVREGDVDADMGTLCCTGCLHLGNDGCKVKALACRMWLCNAAIKNLMEKYQSLPAQVVALLKEIQETHRTCGFYKIPLRSRHSMRENMAEILDNEQWTMDNGQWTMDNEQWTMNNGQ
ncbi:hypothetical protein FACS1894156_4650 [Bacteroidia bacterium]|nr:hypothetical protein FACS1894156_4650 [Bacteroidia bacterium]